jgi:hypothetical protein
MIDDLDLPVFAEPQMPSRRLTLSEYFTWVTDNVARLKALGEYERLRRPITDGEPFRLTDVAEQFV